MILILTFVTIIQESYSCGSSDPDPDFDYCRTIQGPSHRKVISWHKICSKVIKVIFFYGNKCLLGRRASMRSKALSLNRESKSDFYENLAYIECFQNLLVIFQHFSIDADERTHSALITNKIVWKIRFCSKMIGNAPKLA